MSLELEQNFTADQPISNLFPRAVRNDHLCCVCYENKCCTEGLKKGTNGRGVMIQGVQGKQNMNMPVIAPT